jgi:UDP-N-acetylmuramoyl-tripeptide--D-alanyl-D-alanine ligase
MFPINITSFNEMFSKTSLLTYITVAISVAVFLYFASLKFVLSLQQCGYRAKKYFKWVTSPETPYLSRLMLLCLLGFLFFSVLNITFSPITGNELGSFIGLLSFYLFTFLYIKSESSVNAKVPLKKTKRIVRLIITYVLVLVLFSFGFITLLNYLAFLIGSEIVALLRLSLICALPIITPFLLFIAYLINEPFERILRKSIIKRATEKLDKSSVLKIAITGSYAKTSVKEILKTILSQKFRVLATPESYNTPLGISLTTKKLDGTHDIFIVEMGARRKGDIKELADMVKPNLAILTGINNQHLETFGSEEIIKNTKYELFESLKDGAKAFFSSDSEGSLELFNRFSGEKYLAGLNGENNFVWAKDIKLLDNVLSFNLMIENKAVPVSTTLLGKHNISNICLAVSVALKLGMSIEEITLGVNRLTSVWHRLELVANNKDVTIIDDSYNSNVNGFKAAMEVLDLYDSRKIVLTPGLVELGKMENLVNYELGKLLSAHANIVIVIGKHNAEMLINGLKDGGMDVENIHFAKNLQKANEYLNSILRPKDVVLFENDLPDNYN